MIDPIKAFGTEVRVARAKRGLTQIELAELLHTTDRTISKIETGKTNTKLDTVAQYMHDLDISLDTLFLADHEGAIPMCVRRYFSGMSEEKARKYIALCEQADLLSEE